LKSNVLVEPALVGREHEFEELQQYLELAVKGKGTTVFVSGEAGTGKTRLVNEFLNFARQKKEIEVITGWCLSNADVPYFPFIEAFNSYFSIPREEHSFNESEDSSQTNPENLGRVANSTLELSSWLQGPLRSGLMGNPLYLSPQALKDQTFAAVTKGLLGISAERPIVLFIDDLHWADSASLALLHYLSRFIISRRVLILATFRCEDLNPDNEGRPHPLIETLRLMARENLFKEVKMSSLDQSDVSLLAENMIGGRIQSDFAEKIMCESQGNPLFVVESLRMLSEKGNLVQENNRWRLTVDEVGIPNKIKDIILRRVEVLKPHQRKLLDLASVIGAKFDPELLAKLLDQNVLDVLELLSGIAKSTSLVVGEGNYYRFDHAKGRDALYEEISPMLKRAYHGIIAEKLENSWKTEKLPVSDLAFHYARAGNKEKAIKYALAAGEEALALFCGAEAIKQFTYVVNTTEDAIEYADARTTALEGLGDGLYARARCADATKVFEELSITAKSDLVKLRALRKGMYTAAMQGDLSYARKLAGKAVENPKLDRLENARVHLNKGTIIAYEKGNRNALSFLEEALKVFEEEYSLPDIAETLIWISLPFADNGQLEDCLASLLRSCALASYMRDINKQHVAHTYLDIAFLLFGLLREAQESNAESFKLAEKVSDPVSLAWEESIGYWVKAIILHAIAQQKMLSAFSFESMGDLGTGARIKFLLGSIFSGALGEFKRGLKAAVIEALKGAECAEETDSYYAQAINYTELIQLYAELGDMDQSEKYYKKMVKLISETSVAEMQYVYSSWLFSEAVFFSCKRQWKEANQFYEEYMERYKKRVEYPMAFQAAHKLSYGMALLQQKRSAEAKLHFEEAKKIMNNLETRFMHSSIQAYLIAPKKVDVGKEFHMRLDLVNVAKNPGVLIRVEGLVPKDFTVVNTHPIFDLKNGSVELEKKVINLFQDEAINLTVQAIKEGTFNLSPRVTYIDDLGETKTASTPQVTINVQVTQKPPQETAKTVTASVKNAEKPFQIFLCYKKSSGKDFADHLKAGLEELGFHTFQDCKDIPLMTGNEEKWNQIRDQALLKSPIFILLMTPGFELSAEVVKELNMARKVGDKRFIFFRIRSMGRKFSIKLDNEIFETGKQEQVSFETKEELLRLAHGILFK